MAYSRGENINEPRKSPKTSFRTNNKLNIFSSSQANVKERKILQEKENMEVDENVNLVHALKHMSIYADIEKDQKVYEDLKKCWSEPRHKLEPVTEENEENKENKNPNEITSIDSIRSVSCTSYTGMEVEEQDFSRSSNHRKRSLPEMTLDDVDLPNKKRFSN